MFLEETTGHPNCTAEIQTSSADADAPEQKDVQEFKHSELLFSFLADSQKMEMSKLNFSVP